MRRPVVVRPALARLRRATRVAGDLVGSTSVAGVAAAATVSTGLRRRLVDRAGDRQVGGRRLLSLDATYSLATIRSRKLEHELTCRDLGGFFEHVWSVHPAVGASTEHRREPVVRNLSEERIADRHTMIQGTVAWSPRLARFPVVNFLMAQALLVRRLDRLIRREGICAVRVGDPFYLGLMGLLLARLNRRPLVVRINCNYDNAYADDPNFRAYPRLLRSRSLEQAIARFVLARADLVAPGSRDNLEYALANGATPERSTVWSYGTWVDPLHFALEPEDRPSVRPELGLGDRPFIVLVSRLETVKHPDDVVRVLAEARRRNPALAALLVGGGTMQVELEELARELDVADHLYILGYRDQPWLAAALSSANVVVSTITGRALVEACLSATPVVAYDIEWQSELIQTGETGVLVPYRDVERMAAAVCDLLDDPDLARSLGTRARQVVAKTMDPMVLLAHEQADYERLLAGRATS